MLTRTSERDDFAPDGSIYPLARDAQGGRQLEVLAFEVVSSESLAHAGDKAASMVRRGLEWSRDTDGWEILAADGVIDDPALVLPLPVHDLVAAANADDAVARALLAKHNPVLEAQWLAAKVEALITVLVARGLSPSDAERRRLLECRDAHVVERWLAAVATCGDVGELLDDD